MSAFLELRVLIRVWVWFGGRIVAASWTLEHQRLSKGDESKAMQPLVASWLKDMERAPALRSLKAWVCASEVGLLHSLQSRPSHKLKMPRFA